MQTLRSRCVIFIIIHDFSVLCQSLFLNYISHISYHHQNLIILSRLFLLSTPTPAYQAAVEGPHPHPDHNHNHHDHQHQHHDHHDPRLILIIILSIMIIMLIIMIRYGHCYEYLSGGAMFSACSCLAGFQ